MLKQNKRDLILDAMQSLMSQNLASTATVSDIAKFAGIAKGSIYYYFKSKDEILDAVIERAYSKTIEQSWNIMQSKGLDALSKVKQLFQMCVYPDVALHQQDLLTFLHLQDDLTLHNKFLKLTIREFTPILTEILEQAEKENNLCCEFPEQTAEIVVSSLVFLLDHTIYDYDEAKIPKKLHALAVILERSMGVPAGTFDFLYSHFENTKEASY